MNTEALIAAQLAKPITHHVIITYADGRQRIHGTRSAGAAKTHVDFVVRPRLGRDLIDRETGNTVRIVSVEIVEV